MNHIAVIGAGSWGTALAFTAAQNVPAVTLLGRDAAVAAEINADHRNRRYTGDVALPHHLHATTTAAAIAGVDAVLFAMPSKSLRAAAASLQVRPDTILVSCAKGIERESGLRMTQVLSELFPQNPVAVISGPNHAEEITQKLAAAAVIGSASREVALSLQQVFRLPWFRTYTSDDVTGIEWGGAVKNVFAIAAGISEGLGLGDNARAALVTRGLAEMTRIGIRAGGRFDTFQGLSGVGDLIVTCYSQHSRNNRLGRLLGKGESLAQIIRTMQMEAEGVPNTESIYLTARRLGVRTPIIDQMYAILYQEKNCVTAMKELLSRDPRDEAE